MGIVSLNASAKDVPLKGDVNGDGIVDVADIVCVVNHIIQNPTDVFHTDKADVNADDRIDVADIVCIVSVIMKNANAIVPDTIKITYQSETVSVEGNYDKNMLQTSITGAMVKLKSSGKRPFVCLIEGESADGGLIVDADTTCTMILNGLQLTSQASAAISFPKKQKVNIELPKGSQNILCDAASRDEKDDAKACLFSKGNLSFTGKGSLTVTGKYGHGIASSKNVTVDGCQIIVEDVIKNGIHCDKFTLKKGQIDLHLQNDASKGIKTKEDLVIKGGTIEGDAKGGITNKDGDLSYSSLLKSDGTMNISGGMLILKHYGDGGRCISVDKDMTMTGGTMNLECFGDGGKYQNIENEQDYYTPKCITVDNITRIERGKLYLLATGNGGKGIACSDTLFIGRQDDDFISEDSLIIKVETRGTALVDNKEEDFRRGCPKAIKCDGDIIAYSGTMLIYTQGQGGEGIESKGSLRAYRSTITADCFDDGINTGQRCYINGAYIYCLSHNNDGIDSNGKLSVMDGVVAGISEHDVDESFDTNGGRLYIYGGIVIGIGHDEVIISNQTTVPFYSTPSYLLQDHYHHGDNINLQPKSFLSISKGQEIIVSLYHEQAMSDAFVTVASATMNSHETYTISDGYSPLNTKTEWFEGRVCKGGVVTDNMKLFTFKPS